MPLHRTYYCPECAHRMEVVLSADEWDKSPPSCEACDAREMNQEFKPFGIGGSVHARAQKITEDIIANDYHVANISGNRGIGATPKVAYKDQTKDVMPANWSMTGAESHRSILETAINIGKAHRGIDGLNILQKNLASGVQPDLIETSKRRSIKVW